MDSMLQENTYVLRQNQSDKWFWTSAAYSYDLLDKDTGEVILTTKEPPFGLLKKLCRIDRRYRKYTPFNLSFHMAGGNEASLTMKRGMGMPFARSHIDLLDESGAPVVTLRQDHAVPLFARFTAYDQEGSALFGIKGDWAAWDFRVVRGSQEIAHIGKGDGEGIVTELFSTRDNYIIRINDNVPATSPLRKLIVAAAIAIDISCNE